jgi:hypothetical protein
VLADERLGQSQITCLHGAFRWATVGKARGLLLARFLGCSPVEEGRQNRCTAGLSGISRNETT